MSRRESRRKRKTRRMREEKDNSEAWSTETRGRDGGNERETKREEREACVQSQR